MNEKPILFSTPMVQAILAGRKTQTRRVIKHQYSDSVFEMSNGVLCETEPPVPSVKLENGMTRHKVRQFVPCKPKYQPGDILWVRETWVQWADSPASYSYRADGEVGEGGNMHLDRLDKWRSPRFMPRAAARIFLRVTGVRAEQVQDISEADATKEGCYILREHNTPIDEYHILWDALNAKRGYSWDSNPWVWVYSFEAIKQ